MESLAGLVMALGELDRWEAARREIEKYSRVRQNPRFVNVARNYVSWRRNEPLGNEIKITDEFLFYDLQRFWRLEFRWARGAAPGDLLTDVEEELGWTSEEHRALVQSLRADLWAAEGRVEEALVLARRARDQVMTDMKTYPTARAYFDVVTERCARIARQTGHAKEAEDAEDEYRRWRQEQKGRSSYWPSGLEPLVRDSP